MIDNTDDAPRRGLGALLRTRRRKVISGGVIAVLLVGAGTGVAVAATRNDDSRYRTASAEKADVTQTLALTGQLSSSKSVPAAFQVSGTVGKVLVDLGDDVTAGQTLARLDKASLKNAVASADDALANAKQQLENDLEAQSSGSSSTSSSTNATSTGASSDSSSASTVTKAQASSASAASTTTPADGAASADASSSPTSSGSDSAKGTGSGAPSNTTSPGSTSSSDSAAIAAAKKKVTEAQQALLDQYAVTTDAQTDSAQAAADAQTVCKPFLDATISSDGTITSDDTGADTTVDSSTTTTDGSATDDTSTDDTPTGDTSTGDTSTGDTSTDDTSTDDTSAAGTTDGGADDFSNAQSLLADCQSSISDTLDKQQTTSDEQDALQKDADTLDDAVTALVTLIGSGGSQTSTASATPSPSASSTSSSSTTSERSTETPAQQDAAPSDASASAGSAASTTPATTGSESDATSSGGVASSGSPSGGANGQATTVTAEQILADRAAIEAAKADVSVAEQDLEFATLTSPISGKVVSVAMAAGDQVSAASTSAVITVQGDGGYVVTSTVSLSKIAKLEVGQTASVTLPALGKTYTGSVSSIGVQNVSETSTPSYSVTVAVEAGDDSPRIGATARATISVAAAQDVLTVPTSAVTVSGSSASVVTLRDGEPVTTAIEIGAVGSERVEVTKGISAGDEVVLADLDQQITSDSDEESSGLSGLTGSTSGTGRQFPSGFSGSDFPGGGSGGFPGQ